MRWPRAYPCCLRCGADSKTTKPGHRGLCRPCYRDEEDHGRADNWPETRSTYNPARILADVVGGRTAAALLGLSSATLATWAKKGTPSDRAHEVRETLAAVCSGKLKPTEDGSYAA